MIALHVTLALHKYLKLNQHIKTVHEMIKPFTCDICDKSFRYKNNLKRHTMEKHDQKNMELLSPTLLKHKKRRN